MQKCAYMGIDGRCRNESICGRARKRIKCRYPLNKCGTYITENRLTKKHNKRAHDRPLTPLTSDLVHKWHEEGDSVLMIAIILDRTTTAIEKILSK